MCHSINAWKLSVIFLICAGLKLNAQELSLLGGVMTEAGAKNSSYTWQIDYRQDFYRNFASSIDYINEGHVPGHYRDGMAWEAWGNLPFLNDRIAVSLGAGIYYYYDTEPLAGASSADVHGTAPIISFSVTGYLSDRWFYRGMVNRISPTGDIKTTTAAVGVGYWFGRHRRPPGAGAAGAGAARGGRGGWGCAPPGRGRATPRTRPPTQDASFVTEPQFTVY